MDVFSLFLLIGFVLIPVLGVILAIRMLLFERHAMRTHAMVVGERSEPSKSGDFDTVHIHIVEYRDHNGKTRRGELLSQRGRAERHSPVNGYLSILFDKRRPTHIDYADWRTRWIVPLVLMLPGLIALGFLGYAFLMTHFST